MGKAVFLLHPEGFGLIDIDPGHEPVKFPPGQVPDLGLFPWPLITARNRQSFIDQYKSIWFMKESFDAVAPSSAKKEQGV